MPTPKDIEVAGLRADLERERSAGRAWRSAYHSLRLGLEDRVDELTNTLNNHLKEHHS